MLKQFLATTPFVQPLVKKARAFRDGRFLSLSTEFPLFAPQISCPPSLYQELTKSAINRTFPALLRFSRHLNPNHFHEFDRITDFVDHFGSVSKPDELKALFDRYGSDKGDHRSYFRVYDCLIGKFQREITSVFEIGLGTNNTNMPSNMGHAGKPGASLRAFRDFLPKATICGADIDRDILFEEDRIKTFFVDQSDPNSFERIEPDLPEKIDLLIDDGLHATNANINSLAFFLDKIAGDGVLIVEDIPKNARDLWRLVASIMPMSLEIYIVETPTSLLFIARNKGWKSPDKLSVHA